MSFLVRDAGLREMVLAVGDNWVNMGHRGLSHAHSFRKPSVSEANKGPVLQKYVKV